MAKTFITQIGKTLSRRDPTIQTGPARSYIQQSGRLLWIWNRLHGYLCSMFCTMASPNNADIGRAIWHAVKTDSAQRDALLAVVLVRNDIPGPISEAAEWIIKVVTKISHHRNDVTHAAMSVGLDENMQAFSVFPDFFNTDPAKASRLSRSDLKKFHKKLEGDLAAIADYAKFVSAWIALWQIDSQRKAPPLPRKPLLQAILPSEVPLTRSQKVRQQKRQERKRQQIAWRRKSQSQPQKSSQRP